MTTAYDDDLDLSEVDQDGCIFRPPRAPEAIALEEFSPRPDAMVSILRIGDAAPMVNLDLRSELLTVDEFRRFAADVAACLAHIS